MKEKLLGLFLKTLEEISLKRVMAASLERDGSELVAGSQRCALPVGGRVAVAAIGKAAQPMCDALVPLLQSDNDVCRLAVVPGEQPASLNGDDRLYGGHPYPNEGSLLAASRVLEMVEPLDRDDLFICLLSGGGSAVCEDALHPEISLGDLRAFYEVLVTCGANIVEMNILRKHLSRIKGGRLARAAAPARQLTLYISDVPPDAPSTVASGPTMPDESTCEDAYGTAERLGIVRRMSPVIRRLFDDRALEETPKPGDVAFERSQWYCLLDNLAALERLEGHARACGWIVERDLSVDDRPVQTAAAALVDRLASAVRANPGRTVAVTTGGELSSPVKGDGMGGRNQAFVLWAARELARRGMPATVLSAGTDGIDGNSPAAGAIADETTIMRAESLGIDAEKFERRSDSYRFFERLGDLIVTGPTGNNVRDLRMLVTIPC